MPYLTWMADVLRGAGLSVQEVGGWRTRGHGSMSDIRGVLLHHTAGAATGSYPSLGVVRDGRPGLAGPLAQLGLARDGSWLVIAAGQAWHAGLGYVAWCGRDNGNQHLIGVEAESTGRGDWTPAQLHSYPRGVAALLRHLRLGPQRAIGHKEWAPTRKIDPAGWPGDMHGFRAQVAGGQEDEVELHTTYKDWAGNTQTVQGTFNHLDQRLAELHAAVVNKVPSRVNPAVTLQPLQFLPFIDGYTNATAAKVQQLEAGIAGLTAALAAIANDQDLDAERVEQIVRDAVQDSIQITGTVEITSKENV